MKAFRTLFALFAVLAALVFVRPAQAQISLSSVTWSYGTLNSYYVGCAVSGIATAWESSAGAYNTQTGVSITSVEVFFYGYGGTLISDTSYSLDGNSTYHDDTITYGYGTYGHSETFPCSDFAEAVPPGGYATWQAWFNTIKPSSYYAWKLRYHAVWYFDVFFGTDNQYLGGNTTFDVSES